MSASVLLARPCFFNIVWPFASQGFLEVLLFGQGVGFEVDDVGQQRAFTTRFDGGLWPWFIALNEKGLWTITNVHSLVLFLIILSKERMIGLTTTRFLSIIA